MVTTGLLIAAVIVIAAFAILLRQRQTRLRTLPLTISAFPLALLLLVAPVPLTAIQMIRDFAAIGESGTARINQVAVVAMTMVRPLWVGCLACVIVLGAAAVLEWLNVEAEPEDSRPPAPRAWASLFAGLSTVLLIPATMLIYNAKGTALLLLKGATSMTPPGPAATVAGMPLHEFSQMMSSRLLLASIGGGALALVVIGSAGLGVVAHRFGTRSVAIERVSLAATTLGVMAGISLLLLLAIDMRLIASTAIKP